MVSPWAPEAPWVSSAESPTPPASIKPSAISPHPPPRQNRSIPPPLLPPAKNSHQSPLLSIQQAGSSFPGRHLRPPFFAASMTEAGQPCLVADPPHPSAI